MRGTLLLILLSSTLLSIATASDPTTSRPLTTTTTSKLSPEENLYRATHCGRTDLCGPIRPYPAPQCDPWTVRISRENEIFTGFLISDRHVLTASHVFPTSHHTEIVGKPACNKRARNPFGDWNFKAELFIGDDPRDTELKLAVSNATYFELCGALYSRYRLVLLELEHPVNPEVATPLCIAEYPLVDTGDNLKVYSAAGHVQEVKQEECHQTEELSICLPLGMIDPNYIGGPVTKLVNGRETAVGVISTHNQNNASSNDLKSHISIANFSMEICEVSGICDVFVNDTWETPSHWEPVGLGQLNEAENERRANDCGRWSDEEVSYYNDHSHLPCLVPVTYSDGSNNHNASGFFISDRHVLTVSSAVFPTGFRNTTFDGKQAPNCEDGIVRIPSEAIRGIRIFAHRRVVSAAYIGHCGKTDDEAFGLTLLEVEESFTDGARTPMCVPDKPTGNFNETLAVYSVSHHSRLNEVDYDSNPTEMRVGKCSGMSICTTGSQPLASIDVGGALVKDINGKETAVGLIVTASPGTQRQLKLSRLSRQICQVSGVCPA